MHELKTLKKSLVIILCILLTVLLASCSTNTNKKVEESSGTSEKPSIVWPKMAITLNTSKAGTSVDANARIVAKHLTNLLGTNIIVNNTAGQVDAARETLTADPDGYTLCFTNNTVVINDVAGTLEFDSVEDFEIVGITSQGASNWIGIRTKDAEKWNVKTLNDLFAYCEKHPGELMISSQQNTNTAGAAFGLIKSGLKVTPADAGTTDERLTNFLSGNIDIFIGAYNYIEQYIQTGEVICLASCSKTRTAFTPDIPSTYELGYEVEFPSLYYLSAPKGTPEEIIEILGKAIGKMVGDPEFAEDVKNSTQEPVNLSPGESADTLKNNKQKMIDIGITS